MKYLKILGFIIFNRTSFYRVYIITFNIFSTLLSSNINWICFIYEKKIKKELSSYHTLLTPSFDFLQESKPINL